MSNYEIVRVRKKWEVRADGIVKATFDSKSDAQRAVRELSEMPTRIGRAHDDAPGNGGVAHAADAQGAPVDARRRSVRPASRRKTNV
jgi:hypothetical protein